MGWLARLDDKAVWAILFALTTDAIFVALAFEHVGGYAPCPLCYQQRWPYYALIALSLVMTVALFLEAAKASPLLAPGATPKEIDHAAEARSSSQRLSRVSRIMLVAALFILIASAVMGAHHAGVEWGWWPGPDTCAGGSATQTGGSLIERMQTAQIVRCDQPAARFLGLSFAGSNAALSSALAALVFVYLLNRRGGETAR